MLFSTFLTACFGPVTYECSVTKVKRYLNTVREFLMPVWLGIMGAE